MIKMIQNQKIKLLSAWKKYPFNELSISEIMGITGKKTKPWVFNSLKLLAKNKLLTSRRKGNLDIYTLNMDNPFLLQAIQYLESQENLDFAQLGVIIDIIKSVPVKNCCIVVFGSYASKKQTSSSDIDMCFLIEDKSVEKRIKPYFNEVKLNHAVKIDEHYIPFTDFVKMLLRKEENIATQIFRNHILFFNAEIYYCLVKEAYERGFRP